MDKLKTLGTIVGILGAVSIVGCGPYSGGGGMRTTNTTTYYRSPSPPSTPGYSGRSYGVTRDQHGRVIERHGAVWGGGPSREYRIGLPRNPTPQNIQRKFRQDVQRARARGR